jgi:hypothetical protein
MKMSALALSGRSVVNLEVRLGRKISEKIEHLLYNGNRLQRKRISEYLHKIQNEGDQECVVDLCKFIQHQKMEE